MHTIIKVLTHTGISLNLTDTKQSFRIRKKEKVQIFMSRKKLKKSSPSPKIWLIPIWSTLSLLSLKNSRPPILELF